VNRLSRDQLIHRALSEAHLAGLDEHDRPGGVITPEAYTVAWLQDGLDLFHHLYPVAGQILQVALTLATGTNSVSLAGATRFTLAVKDGLVITGPSRVVRARQSDYTSWLDYVASGDPTTGPQRHIPSRYFVKGASLTYWPTPDQTYAATLDYHALPAEMTKGSDTPVWPSDQLLVDYLVAKAREWALMVPPGTAQDMAEKAVGKLRSAGQLAEATDLAIPLDPTVFLRMPLTDNPDAWMGSTVPR
jgi:hypothetical protein